MFGLARGNVGLMVASTNIGKTTYSLNLALSATARREFLPVLDKGHTARKVLYIDGEATKVELQTDIRKMTENFSVAERLSVSKNLFIICDEDLDGETLDLANPVHLEQVSRTALECKPDLIIIDTLSALLDIEDENDNAKIKKEVMKPLKTLAKTTNSALLLLHHSGKYNEGFAPQGAYKGRGASALGALSRLVLNLDKDKNKPGQIVLSSPKVKGAKMTATAFELDGDSRWFQCVEQTEQSENDDKSHYRRVVEFIVEAKKPVKRDEIVEAMDFSAATVGRKLTEAVKNKDLVKGKYGYYSAPQVVENNQEMPLAK